MQQRLLLLVALCVASLLLASSAQAADYKGAAAYQKWLKENGIKSDGLSVNEFVGYGLGVETSKDIKTGDLMMSIPVETFLNSRVARTVTLKFLVDAYPEVNDQLLLGLAVLAEKYNAESKFSGWLNALPTTYNTPLYFSESDMKELKGSSIVSLAKSRLEQMQSTYDSLSEFMQSNSTYAEVFPKDKFTFDDFKWAVSTVAARSFTLNLADGSVVCLIPGLDMINHGNVPTDFKFNNETRTFDVLAGADFAKGEQVFVNTGKKTNLDLLLSNGYVLDDPSYDVVLINTRLNDEAEDVKLKKAILELRKINTDGFFFLSLTESPDELFTALRIQLAKGQDLVRLAATNDTSVGVSLDNELTMFRTVLAAAETMFREYETSIEEDEQRLKRTLSPNVRSAVRLRKGEKEVLQQTVNRIVSAWRDILVYNFPPVKPDASKGDAQAAAATVTDNEAADDDE